MFFYKSFLSLLIFKEAFFEFNIIKFETLLR